MYREIKQEELKYNIALNYLYFMDKEHPLAIGKGLWVYYHRHVASLKLGRWLNSDEIVHHINHNKLDNRVENLEVMSRAQHTSEHNPKKTTLIPCEYCKVEFMAIRTTSKYCSDGCKHKASVLHKEVTKEYLEPLIWEFGYSGLKDTLNMSDKGIKKMAIRLGCTIPPPYFHQKCKDKATRMSKYLESL